MWYVRCLLFIMASVTSLLTKSVNNSRLNQTKCVFIRSSYLRKVLLASTSCLLMCDKNVGPQLRLVLGPDAEEVWTPYEQAVLDDAFQSFQQYHGTGTSFLHFCAVHFLRHLRRNEVGITYSSLQDAVQIIDIEYCQCCKALELRDDTVHKISSSSSGILGDSLMQQVNNGAGTEDFTATEEEDTSWYFDGTDDNTGDNLLATEEQLAIPHESSASVSSCVPPKSLATADTSELKNELFSHEWLITGLQHCTPHDYSAVRESTCDIALPMQLAGTVRQHLWPPRPAAPTPRNQRVGANDIDIAAVTDILHEMCTTEGRLKAPLSKHLHVRSITGLPVARSCVVRGALVLGCNSRDFDRVRTIHTTNSADNAKDRICAAQMLCPAKNCAIFSRTVVVGANLGMLGQKFNEQNCALGNSQQARSVQFTNIVSAEAYIYSLRANVLHEQSSYVQRICTVLVHHQVQLLLCHAGMMTIHLVDCLAAHNIAVLPLQTTQELNSAANITGAEVIDDIIALQDCDIGCHGVCIKHVLELPPANAKYKPPNISHSENSDDEQEELCIGGLRTSADGVLQVGDESEQQCLVKLSRTPSASHFKMHDVHVAHDEESSGQDPVYGGGPVSVLICAPTEIMTQAITDRFYRCLHRLRAVAEDNDGCAVIPGAGVLEILCILRLDEAIGTLSADIAASTGTGSPGRAEDVRGQVEVIRLFQQVLVEYLCTIMLNSGCSYAESFEQINNTLCALRERVNNSVAVDSSDTLTYISALPNEEKMALPQPIRLEGVPIGEQVLVLDAARVKMASLQSALHVVCELAGLRYV